MKGKARNSLLTEAVMENALLREREVAAYLNLELATLRNWRYMQAGPPYIKIGHTVRYRLADVLDWLKTNTVAAGSSQGQGE